MKKVKVILLDLDNTLYEYEPVHKKALRSSHKILKMNNKLSFNKFVKIFNLSKSEIHRELSGTASSHNRVLYFQRLIEKTHKTIEPEIILKMYNAYWDTFLKHIKLEAGVLSTLKEIKKRKRKIIILSDLTAHIQMRKIKKLGLTPYIDFLVTSEEAGREKPHPSMFLLALNKVGVLPQEAIVVGDDLKKDVEGANSLGIKSILLKRKKERLKLKEDYKKPDYIINNISQILNLI